MNLTPEIIRAASTDAGNRSMRAAGRHQWAKEDLWAAQSEWHRLTRLAGLPPYGNEPMLPAGERKETNETRETNLRTD